MKIFLTGVAGFIGFHTCIRLLKEGYEILGVDNINTYYDTNLKKSRLEEIHKFAKLRKLKWTFKDYFMEDEKKISDIFFDFKPDIVLHLAAQAGVRYSLENPKSYINSNLVGFHNILELCRRNNIQNFIYASSSSVYGGNKKMPFSEKDPVDHPVSLYAATKKSNEIMAHCYSHLYNIPSTGLRFFTVYGPWGRPDMAPMIFANAISKKIPINIFNFGKMKRDFTYIDDVVEAIVRCCKKPARANKSFDEFNPDPSSSCAPYRVFNLGNSKPIELIKFIECIENEMGIKAIKNYMPMQPGDVEETSANTNALKKMDKFYPRYFFRKRN